MRHKPMAAALVTLGLSLGAGCAFAEFPAGTSPVLLPMPAIPRGPYPSSFDDLKPSAQQLASASVVSRVLLDLAKDPKNQNPQKRGELEQMLRSWTRAQPILVAVVTAEMRTQVSQLYVSMFGRAPDAGGFDFWVTKMGNGESVASVAQQMFNTNAARTTYPAFLTNQEIIGKFYSNVLGRTADPEGLAYWTARLNSKGATPGAVITEMIHSVATYTGSDPDSLKSAALFANKVSAAESLATTMQGGGASTSKEVLVGVTAGPAGTTSSSSSTGTTPPGNTTTLDPEALKIAAQNVTTSAVVNSLANSPFAGQGGAGSTFTFNEVSTQVIALNEAGANFLGTQPGLGTGAIPTTIIVPVPPITFSTVSQVVQAVVVNLVNGQQVTTQGTANVQDLVTQAATSTGGSTNSNGSSTGSTGNTGGNTLPPVNLNLAPTPLADIAALNAGNMGFSYNGTSATLGQAMSFFVSYGSSPFFSGSIQGGTLPAGALGNSFIVNGNISGNSLNATFFGGTNVVSAGSTFSATLTGPSATGINSSYSVNVNKSGGGTVPVADTGRMTR